MGECMRETDGKRREKNGKKQSAVYWISRFQRKCDERKNKEQEKKRKGETKRLRQDRRGDDTCLSCRSRENTRDAYPSLEEGVIKAMRVSVHAFRIADVCELGAYCADRACNNQPAGKDTNPDS